MAGVSPISSSYFSGLTILSQPGKTNTFDEAYFRVPLVQEKSEKKKFTYEICKDGGKVRLN